MTDEDIPMSEQIGEHLATMTAANGFIPFIVDVQIVSSLDDWKRKNLSVAVLSDTPNECGVFIHCNDQDSRTEQQLRDSITEFLSKSYTVIPESSGLPLLVSQENEPEEQTDDVTE